MKFLVCAAVVAMTIIGPMGTGIGLAEADPTTDPGAEPDEGVSQGGPQGGPSGSPETLDDWDRRVPEYDKLRTPDSPAFVVLGVSPSEIQRPTTPRALTIAVNQFISGADIIVPKNFALEVSPYWLFPHPDLTLKELEKRGVENIVRSFTVSVGTTQTVRTVTDAMGGTTDHTDSDIGFGIRTSLYQEPFTTQSKCSEFLQQVAQAAKLTQAERDAIEVKHGKGTPAYSAANQDAAAQEIADEMKKRIKDIESKVAEDVKCFTSAAVAKGWAVDFAAALGVHSADSQVTQAKTSVDVGAAWFAGSYTATDMSAVVLARFMGRRTDTDPQYVLDSGLSLIWKSQDYAVSIEGLVRRRLSGPGEPWTGKADLSAEYEITSGTWVTLTFGKDFEVSPGEVGALFTLANLKWGIGKPIIHASSQ